MHRLAVFASGSGTNFEAIVTACERGELPAEAPGALVTEMDPPIIRSTRSTRASPRPLPSVAWEVSPW